MQNFSKRSAVFFILFSAFVLLSALTVEHIFDMTACQLCIYQRYPYVVLLLFNVSWVLWGFARRYHRWVNGSILLINVLLPFLHVLVEMGIIVLKCSPSPSAESPDAMFELLQRRVPCVTQTVVYSFTFAEFHLVVSLVLLALFMGYLYARKRR